MVRYMFADSCQPRWFGQRHPRYNVQYPSEDDMMEVDMHQMAPLIRWLAEGRLSSPTERSCRSPRLCRTGDSCKQRPQFTVEDWSETVHLSGFSAKDLAVSKRGERLCVRAVHTEGEPTSESGLSRREIVRYVSLPTGCILPSVEVNTDGMESDGKLIITGKKLVKKESKPQSSKTGETEEIPEEKESKTEEKTTDSEAEVQAEEETCSNCEGSDQEEMEVTETEKQEGNDGCHMEESTNEKMVLTKPLEIKLNVAGFDDEDIKVKVADDRIVVTAEHKEQSDGLYTYKKMERSFPVPEGTDVEGIRSQVNDENILIITTLPQITLQQQQNVEDKPQDSSQDHTPEM